MNVGIVTFHNAPSHGAFFQAYALATYLRKAGHDVHVVDYMPDHRKAAFKRPHVRLSFRRAGLNRANLRWLKTHALSHFDEEHVFYRAASSFIPLTPIRYCSLEELRGDPPPLDACFFGSDQIWNCAHTGGSYDAAYFGGFGGKQMRRVAYAASFGERELRGSRDELATLLGLLDSVSVRERSAIPIVRAISGKSAHLVLDPTLLISPDEYPRTYTANGRGHHVLAYLIERSDVAQAAAHRIARRLGTPLVDLANSGGIMRSIAYPTPQRLLRLLKEARHVVTNSFHGLALALVHRVDFTVVGLVGPSRCRNTRMVELLESLDLCHRFIGSYEAAVLSEVCFRPIDWSTVSHTLENMAVDSKRFICESLNDTRGLSATEPQGGLTRVYPARQ